jgi:hypothetical protein
MTPKNTLHPTETMLPNGEIKGKNTVVGASKKTNKDRKEGKNNKSSKSP